MKDVKVIKSQELSHGWERRYVVVDTVTREVLDDAQGYGYKSIQNAYAAYNYKSRSKEKAKEIKEEEKKIFGWLKEHKPFCSDLEAASFYAVKGGEKFGIADFRKLLDESGLSDTLPCEAKKVFNAWKRGKPQYKK